MKLHVFRRGAAAGVLLTLAASCSDHALPPAADGTAAKSAESSEETHAFRGAHGQPLVHVDSEAQQRAGIATAPSKSVQKRPEQQVFGRCIADPARLSVVRAPIAGVWRRPADAAPLTLGLEIAAGADLGRIEPRLSAVERADAIDRLGKARADVASTRAELDGDQKDLARTEELNRADKNASDRSLELARARVETDKARLAGAASSVTTLEGLLAPNATAAAAIPLHAEHGGRIASLDARPGDAVEAGIALLRITDASSALLRLELPFEASASVADGTELRVVSAFDEHATWTARAVGLDPATDTPLPARALLARIDGLDARTPLAPGVAVRAFLPLRSDAVEGVEVPRSAVVRLAGRTWVYVRADADDFERVPVELDVPIEDGWFVRRRADAATDLGGLEIVVVGAELVLSAEAFGSATAAAEGD